MVRLYLNVDPFMKHDSVSEKPSQQYRLLPKRKKHKDICVLLMSHKKALLVTSRIRETRGKVKQNERVTLIGSSSHTQLASELTSWSINCYYYYFKLLSI